VNKKEFYFIISNIFEIFLVEILDQWDGLNIIIRAERSKEYTTNANAREHNGVIISVIG
jgi:hypothetical protein